MTKNTARQDRSVETEMKIIDASMRLGLDKGIENTTIREICAEAGISIGAFYHHFNSKKEMINHAFIIFDAGMTELIAGVEGGDPISGALDILMIQTRFIAENAASVISDYYVAILSDPQHHASDPKREYYREVGRRMSRAGELGLLRDGISPELASSMLLQFVRGSIINWCLRGRDYDVVEYTKKGLDIFCRGLFTDDAMK